ncbi:1-pyrroline-5-carboxylate dehydrogenase [Helicobacter sp. 12S02634-8]|uniref:bifunctional proline dehydrogenase/L-glutamate gamma-semialdehyde dehydrogenase n=1 Tax=Helicobacter sp. 12S02634-8 TaxID=1476199 RepID=UPI000BA7A958|nr:proline dehydrogenase family protein [Helicobacter sp. 12S02634-8]PAF47590.1 1-pyrroline-5-carboxylate dehydrogenase [Helicobacter sp. 12S02634-8]
MDNLVSKSIQLAEMLQEKITQNISASEKKFHQKMQKLLDNPKNKVMLIELLDRSFRCFDNKARFNEIEYILGKYGIADFFSAYEKFLLMAFLSAGKLAPNMSVPFFVNHIREDTKTMVLDEEKSKLDAHIIKREEQGITLNVNLIGEEVLGEAEALYRMHKYEEALKSEHIKYISIKITTIFSQINIIDFDYSKNEVIKRLDTLYGIAQEYEKRHNVQKFINLDMEEFRDLELTVAAFMESVAKFDINAGIVLQAYIPDSLMYLQKLHAFSKQRVQSGKPPIKIRFVKGANMESEETIASQKGWALPTFSRKMDTDSNYNKMLNFILEGDNYKYIKIGIASHNIFEIAYAYTRIEEKNAQESFTFEMLEGMSLQASYELSQMHQLILYAPVCNQEHFNNAIAYLVRRLDENTSEDNFMRYFFNLKVGSKNWEIQKQLFLDSLSNIAKLDNATHRVQNRLLPQKGISTYGHKEFHNESDTDFILPQNREWAQKIKDKYSHLPILELYPIAGERLEAQEMKKVDIFDKIANKKIATIALANQEIIQKALQIAKDDNSKFSQMDSKTIHQILSRAAQNLREKRGDLIGIAALEVGKTYAETDAEVSEAIDFLEFYPYSLEVLKEQNPKTHFAPRGVGVVIAPWNFPVGISAGTIAAPLAAGNRVIYKPSSLSSVTGYMLCECFWEAGIPRDALIYLPAKGSDISKYLLKDPAVSFAVLTGGEDTAYKMLEANPALLLSAETGGKNATIVSKMADRDQAIKNIIHSAFSNSGQKCSATSLLILEEEVYNDENFKKTLIDATKSMSVGDPFVLKNKIGTLADKVSDKVQKAIDTKEAHEEWAIQPEFIDNNPYLMKPAIKYGTKEGDYTHKTELFVPILSVMCAKDLPHAISIVNATGYGLTSGLESLDEREWDYYIQHIQAGNIYINKPTTGAIVLRQPFGGVKKSAIGFGRKVGIFNYITQFTHITQETPDTHLLSTPLVSALENLQTSPQLNGAQKHSLDTIIAMAKSYAYHNKNEFQTQKDYVHIRGEDNLFSYTKVKSIGYRIHQTDSLEDIMGVIIGANTCGIPLSLSITSKDDNPHFAFVASHLSALGLEATIHYENAKDFADKISQFERVRYFGESDGSDPIYIAGAKNAIVIAAAKPLINGRFELLYYHLEKSVSISYHRYGNLGARALVKKD